MTNDSLELLFVCLLGSLITVSADYGLKWELNEHVCTAAGFIEHSSQEKEENLSAEPRWRL